MSKPTALTTIMTDWARVLDEELSRSMYGGTGTSSNAVQPSLTAEGLIANMEEVRKLIEQPAEPLLTAMTMLGGQIGIRVHETPHAVRRVRVKTYPKRKAKSASHWYRMDKKWRKRYGYREVPQAYIIQRGAFPGAEGLLLHPSQMALLRNFSV